MAESQVTLGQLLGNVDPNIKIQNVLNRPYLKQFSVLNKKSTSGHPKMYVVYVEADTEKIEMNTKLKLYCSCLDFTYRYAYCFYEKDALYTRSGFVIEPPDITNPDCKIKGCKHIKASLKYAVEKGI